MRKYAFVVLLLLASVFYWMYIQPAYRTGVGEKDEAPDFVLKDGDGKELRLGDFRGKVVLIHFWATWCFPCVEEFPLLDQFQKNFPSDKFVLLAISEDDEKSAVEKFRKKIEFDFPVLFDLEQKVSDLYGTYRLPETYVVDKNGIIVKKIIGPQNWAHPKWVKLVRQYLP